MGYHRESLSAVLVLIRVVSSRFRRGTLNAIFLDWMERSQKFVDINGEYVR
jgi:hypothetical protein